VIARRACLLFASLSLAACEPTLPPASPHAFVASAPHPPPIQVCWVEYATNVQPASYGLAGSSEDVRWDVTFSGLLIRHPKGDVLIDSGRSSHFVEEIETASFLPRQLLRSVQGGGDVVASAPEALRRVGEDPLQLKAIVLSHIHGDHAGGIMDLPGTPVILAPEELAYASQEKNKGGFDVIRAHALAVEARAQPIQFTATPYENFDRSADLYGDGSIVFVPLGGHTPGSIGTFVNRSPEARYFHVGDAVNLLEAVKRRRGKSIILEFTDHDGDQADAGVAKLTQLHAVDPSLVILPAHDREAWRGIFGAPSRCLPPR
jgi:N-acyl homoserine lactone hydrolase